MAWAVLSEDEREYAVLQPPGWAALSEDEGVVDEAVGGLTSAFVPSAWRLDKRLSDVLRDYQFEGVRFMIECLFGRKVDGCNGCILADGMGMGKTLQAITVIHTMLTQGGLGVQGLSNRAVVLCPATLVSNWLSEFRRWLGNRCMCFAVTKPHCAGEVIQRFKASCGTVLVLSYEVFWRRFAEVDACKPKLIVCDEAHRLKNPNGQVAKAIGSMSTRLRLLITGTPVQNNWSELFALMDLANPGHVGKRAEFIAAMTWMGGDAGAADPLGADEEAATHRPITQVIERCMLVRSGIQGSNALPPKRTFLVFVTPTVVQTELYRHVLAREGAQSSVSGTIQGLQRLLLHPSLCSLCGSSQEHAQAAASGKMLFVESLLQSLRPIGDKVLVVSNSTAALSILEGMCAAHGWPVQRLDGCTPPAKRVPLVNGFNRPEDNCFVFLLSSKAGGCGLNIIGANRLIMCDADWNPASDLQAMARIWRTGQTKQCFIYRLFTAGTIDEVVLSRQISKTALSAVLPRAGGSVHANIAFEALSEECFLDLIDLQESEPCRIHSALACVRCRSAHASYTEQLTEVDESDFNTWSHHRGVSGVEDVALQQAAQRMHNLGLSEVTFVMGCCVAPVDVIDEPRGQKRKRQERCSRRMCSPRQFSRDLHVDHPKSSSLDDIASWCVGRLGRRSLAELAAVFGARSSQPLRLASFCSGLDPPHRILQSIASACQAAHLPALRVQQVIACEIVPVKQRWIKLHCNGLGALFADITEMGNDTAHCLLDDERKEIESCDIVYAGFSCKSASGCACALFCLFGIYVLCALRFVVFSVISFCLQAQQQACPAV